MSTLTRSHTETTTHARYVAAKIVTDLKRLQRLLGRNVPSDLEIDNYRKEAELYLSYGYLDTVTYGFFRDGCWVLALKYKVTSSNGVSDQDPGSLDANRDVSGASFNSFLMPSNTWFTLSEQKKNEFEALLPFQRGPGREPYGVWGVTPDNSYKSGDIAVNRISLVKP